MESGSGFTAALPVESIIDSTALSTRGAAGSTDDRGTEQHSGLELDKLVLNLEAGGEEENWKHADECV